MQLTPQQLDGLERDGFLVLPELFAAREVAAIAARLPALFAAEHPANIHEKASREVRTAMGLHLRDPIFARLVRHPRLLGPAQQIRGEELYVQQVKVNVKPAFEGEVWQWHYDFATHHGEDGVPRPLALNLHVFLDDVTELNGPLYFIPGSHTYGAAAARLDTTTTSYPLWVVERETVRELCDAHGLVAATGPAGTGLMFVDLLVHASPGNLSPYDRRIFSLILNPVANAQTRFARPEHNHHRDFTPVTALADDCLLEAVPRVSAVNDDERAEQGAALLHAGYFDTGLAAADPEVAAAVEDELARQREVVELIASENIVSRAVLEAQGSILTNKTVEGLPGARYYGGAVNVDVVERLAVARACQLFGCRFANVQPHSGSQANQAVFHALIAPGDAVLAMALTAGGHLSHGAPFNMSGRHYRVAHYGVRRADGRIDLDEVARLAREHRPKLIVAGGSAYPRALDFAAFRAIAEEVGAYLLVDMAHFAGLVAGGVHPHPFPHAHVVTTTTYKSLRGARGGIVLWDEAALSRKLNGAVFPGVQGSPLLHALAAKAVCLGEALKPEFKGYAAAVLANARALAETLRARGLDVVSGGTDTPIVLLDLRRQGLTGDVASAALDRAGITCNKNAVPFDAEKPTVTSGLRLGTSAATTRGFGTAEFEAVGAAIARVLDALAQDPADTAAIEAAVFAEIRAVTGRFPIY